MTTADLTKRRSYQRSGKVDWRRFGVWSVVILTLVCVLAFVMFLLFPRSFYVSRVGPISVGPYLLSLPLSGAVYLAVRWGRCRNLAVLIAASAAVVLVLFLGYFLCGFFSIEGPRGWVSLNRFPDFIVERLLVNVRRDAAGNPDPAGVEFVWHMVTFELIASVAIVASLAAYATGAYCENCGRWMRSVRVVAPSGTGIATQQALMRGCLEELPPLALKEMKLSAPRALLRLEYCPTMGSARKPCPVYLSITDQRAEKPWPDEEDVKSRSLQRIIMGLNGSLLSHLEISTQETEQLASKSPRLRLPPSSAPQRVLAESPEHELRRLDSAVVRTIAGDQANSVYSTRTFTVAALLSLAPLAALLLGLSMIGLGLWGRPWQLPPNAGVDAVALWTAVGLGLLLVGFGGRVCWLNVDYFNHCYYHRLVRRVIELRPDALVSPDDPDALFVEIVPREQWSHLLADAGDDGGFLRIDESSGTLLFEGLRQRYRIPGHAISACRVEALDPEVGPAIIYVTVVESGSVNSEIHQDDPDSTAAVWEAPFLERPKRLRKNRRALRRRAAEALQRRIQRMMPS